MWRVVLALLVGCGFEGRGRSEVDPLIDASGDSPAIDSSIDSPPRDWYDSAFKRRRQIDIDVTKLTATVMDLPVLISITNHASIAAGGADLRFVSYDNTGAFAHEIERYDAAGTSLVWVRFPMLNMTGNGTFRLWMYYGNATATTTSSGAGVFAPSFVSVHHLGTLADATGHGHTASSPAGNQTPSAATARIGQGRDFDGSNDYLELAGEAAYDFTTSLYASAWVRINSFDVVFQAIITKGDFAWRMQRANNTQFSQFGTNDGENLDGDQRVDDDAWHLVAINYTGTEKQVYVDGVLDATQAYSTALANTAAPLRLGMNPEATLGGQRWWNGLVDEVRISGQARTAAWIRAEHTAVADPSFVTIAPTDETF